MHHRDLKIERLARHRDLIPLLTTWFEEEWPEWYGPEGPGDARSDLDSYADDRALPIGIVALEDGEPRGIAALRADSIPTHPELGPWAAAGLVPRSERRRGIGRRLLSALADEARRLGYRRLYCATSTSATLLQREGWEYRETAVVGGEEVRLYALALDNRSSDEPAIGEQPDVDADPLEETDEGTSTPPASGGVP